MLILNPSDRRPIYEQVVEGISRLIARGVLRPDDPLPSVRSLAAELSVNPNTVQRAYLLLEEKGYIVSVRGKGSFIADPELVRSEKKEAVLSSIRSAAVQAFEAGLSLEEVLSAVKASYESEVTKE